jgi:hypothetical protein
MSRLTFDTKKCSLFADTTIQLNEVQNIKFFLDQCCVKHDPILNHNIHQNETTTKKGKKKSIIENTTYINESIRRC